LELAARDKLSSDEQRPVEMRE